MVANHLLTGMILQERGMDQKTCGMERTKGGKAQNFVEKDEEGNVGTKKIKR